MVTGNLNIRHLCKLLLKGPSYREQRNINWNKVEILCIEAICTHRIRWAKKENVDVRVLVDWEHEVRAFINPRRACARVMVVVLSVCYHVFSHIAQQDS